ncbi:MAG TPA: hypothetical protein VJT81_06535 [Burkholderiales bacterium]|nr:hypothetical protein [Burkholderiales bacterium]
MTAPSKNFITIPDGDVDPDSPLSTGLMTKLRDNDINVAEWLGHGYTPAQAHDHDGVNSKLIPGNVAGNLFNFYNLG